MLSCLSAMASPAANFSLRDLNNQQVSLSEHHDEVVLVTFWATWCTSCLGEMDALNTMHAELGREDFTILAISLDEARDRSKIRPLVVSRGWDFPILWDQGGRVSNIYNPTGGVPYTVVIDAQGEIVLTRQGLTEGVVEEIRTTVVGLLSVTAESPPAAEE
jgi:cytochrome c biogenesis protein CcmG, thiol:disulfide interchange protein DsbE